jgi:hypothetical protein
VPHGPHGFFLKCKLGAEGVAQVVEHLPSKSESLNLNTSRAKKKKKSAKNANSNFTFPFYCKIGSSNEISCLPVNGWNWRT